MTYKEALAKGYKAVFTAWTLGYISRKADVDMLPVYEAKGRRKGLLYVDTPSWQSTRFCIRVYLSKD